MTHLVSFTDVLSNIEKNSLLCRDEINELTDRFPTSRCYTRMFDVQAEYFSRWRRLLLDKNERRGEVALLIQNEHSKILLHTKPFYPKDIERIPTGGIHKDESVLSGMKRELFEETSFRPTTVEFLSLLLYEFRHNGQSLSFPSYLFFIKPDGIMPHAADENEQISGFSWATREELKAAVERLYALHGTKWQDWGAMRAVPHELFLADEPRADS